MVDSSQQYYRLEYYTSQEDSSRETQAFKDTSESTLMESPRTCPYCGGSQTRFLRWSRQRARRFKCLACGHAHQDSYPKNSIPPWVRKQMMADHRCPRCKNPCRRFRRMKDGRLKVICDNCHRYSIVNAKHKRRDELSPDELNAHLATLRARSRAQQKVYHAVRRDNHRVKRQHILSLFGGRCQICRDTYHLELHHLTYKNGSPYAQHNNSKATNLNLREAEANPANFALLCTRCHRACTFYNAEQLHKLAEMVTK